MLEDYIDVEIHNNKEKTSLEDNISFDTIHNPKEKETNTHKEPLVMPNLVEVPKTYRRYYTKAVWIISLFACIACLFLIENPYICLLVILTLLSFSTMFNLISVFIITGPRYFTTEAYFTVFFSYFLGFAKFILFTIDSTYSITIREPKAWIIYTWITLYYFSMIFNFIWIQYISVYWTQDHPRLGQRIKATFVFYLKIFIFISIAFVILLIIIFALFWKQIIETLANFWETVDFILLTIQIGSMVWSGIFYFLLLGYGLIEFPFHFFSMTHSVDNLKLLFEDMKKERKKYEEVVNKYIKNANFLRDLSDYFLKDQTHPREILNYCERIQDNIKQYSSIITYNQVAKYNDEIKSDFTDRKESYKDNTLDTIVEKNMVNIEHIFSYEKQQKMLLRTYYEIRKNCDISGDDTIFYGKARDNNKYEIPIKQYTIFNKIFSKTVGIIFSVLSIVFFLIQWSIPIFYQFGFKPLPSYVQSQYYVYLIVLVIVSYFAIVMIYSYYSLVRFKVFECYTLLTHHSDKFVMLNNAGMFSTILFGVIYNLCLFCYDGQYTTDISSSFAFFTKGNTLTASILWTYPSILTIFIFAFLFRLLGFKMNCIFSRLYGDDDEEEDEIAKKDIKILEIDSKTDQDFYRFLEAFERQYYDAILFN